MNEEAQTSRTGLWMTLGILGVGLAIGLAAFLESGRETEVVAPRTMGIWTNGADGGIVRYEFFLSRKKTGFFLDPPYYQNYGDGEYKGRDISLATVCERAAEVLPNRITIDLPRSDYRHEIELKILDGDKMALMPILRNELAKNLGVTFHRETIRTNILSIVAPNGLPSAFKAAAPTNSSGWNVSSGKWTGHNVAFDGFTRQLGNLLRRPYTNATGFDGRYDFSIELESFAGGEEKARAIVQQLGLELKEEPASVDWTRVTQE